jgi:Protein of unknown function (DUF559)
MGPDELRISYTTHEARAAGLTRAQLRDDGRRVTRGAYVSRAVDVSVRTACAAALGVLPQGAAVSHLSAAALFGAPVPHRWPLTFVVPPGTYRPRRRRLRIHVRSLEEADTTVHRGLPVTGPAQTWLDLAAELEPQDLVVVGDALRFAGHLDADSLDERLRRADGVRGVLRARTWAPALTHVAASRPESLLRFWLLEGDVPDPEPQVPILDRRGRAVAHADLGYRRWKVAVEYEGRQHADREQFGRDLERYSLMAADGWLLLRFGDVHLGRPHAVVDRVARALRSRGASW